ncbi:MAG: substrate-binding domain-containing protein, partial [Solirubrobacterales bacterium]|nr:substrate-binding domain-containing protein [Solirubrobacterales bacterium]
AVDQHKAGTLATEHLLGLGHHNVWHVSGPQDWAETVGRTAGWSDALTAAGIEPPPVLPGDWTPASGYECGRLLANMADVSAVFVASDEMAFGVMQALRENGLAVPDDVSIVAMDDIPLAPYAPTPLTTVRQAFEEIAERVVARLLELLDGDSEPAGEPRLIEPQLIVRASTKRR